MMLNQSVIASSQEEIAIGYMNSRTIVIICETTNKKLRHVFKLVEADIHVISAGRPDISNIKNCQGGIFYGSCKNTEAFSHALHQFRIDGWEVVRLTVSQSARTGE